MLTMMVMKDIHTGPIWFSSITIPLAEPYKEEIRRKIKSGWIVRCQISTLAAKFSLSLIPKWRPFATSNHSITPNNLMIWAHMIALIRGDISLEAIGIVIRIFAQKLKLSKKNKQASSVRLRLKWISMARQKSWCLPSLWWVVNA